MNAAERRARDVRACLTHIAYGSLRDALRAKRKLFLNTGDNSVQPWQCAICHEWHIGHQPWYVREQARSYGEATR